jgi:TolA-binding protein
MIVRLILSLGLLGFPLAALAQDDPDSSDSAQLAPGEEEQGAREGAASIEIEPVGTDKDVDLSDQAAAKREESINLLRTKVIPAAPEERKAELIFRLAELYWEKSKSSFAQEMEAYEGAYREWAEAGQTGQPPKQDSYVRQSERIKQNALDLYRRVLEEYPRYERNDEVLFYLGYNEYEAGRTKDGVDKYLQLIKQFPQSGLVDDAYLQLGEHYFNNNKLSQSIRAYKKAAESDEPRIFNYAIYKLAWCDYNLQEYAAGINKLKRVIDNSERTTDKKSLQLKSEALGDLARFFSYVDEVDTAFAYFKAKGGEDIAIRYTERLGNLFGEQGKWPLQIDAFRLLINRYALSERAPHLQSKIVAAHSQLNQKEKVRTEVERLVDLYRPGTPWYKHHEARGESGQAALEYAYDLTETSLRNLVTEYHRDAQKRKDVETYYLARDIYAKYLDAFSNTKAAYEMRYFYAEVLWALDEWKNAALQYDLVAKAETTDVKAQKQYQREAAYNQILAYERIIKTGKEAGDPTTKKRIDEKKKKGLVDRTSTRVKIRLVKDKEYKEQPIPEVEQQLSRSCDLYFKIADPADKDLPAIKFKAAYVYFKYNHFVEAAKRYFEIIETYPRDKLSKKSANLVLDSLNLQEKWDELAFYAGKFKENDKLVGTDKKFAKDVQELLEGATYLSIQTAETKAKDMEEGASREQAYASVASRFAQFQEDFGDSKYADEATFSAVLIYNNADELDHAIRMAEIYRSTYEPKFKPKATKSRRRRSSKSKDESANKNLEIVQRNHLLLAEFYERIADFNRSAGLYDEFYESYPSHEKAPVALYNAAVYHQGLGDTDTAIDRFTRYYSKHAKGAEAAEVYWRTCGLHEVKETWDEAAKCYNQFRKKYPSASPAKVFESRYKYALMLEKTGNKRDAMKEYRWIVAEFPKLSAAEQKKEGAQLAGAHAKFELLQPEFEAFKKLKINRLTKKVLNRKLNGAQDLACVSTPDATCKSEGKYVQVLTYGNGDYGICALTRIGQVFQNVANSLRDAPIPRRLTADQVEIYRAELDALAIGPEEKGITAYERALDKAYELNIYNRCTLTAQELLKEYDASKFPDLQKPGFRGADVFIVSESKPAEQVPDEVIEEQVVPAGTAAQESGSKEQASLTE